MWNDLLLINVDQKYEKRNISTMEMESMFVCSVWCRVTFWSPEYFDCWRGINDGAVDNL